LVDRRNPTLLRNGGAARACGRSGTVQPHVAIARMIDGVEVVELVPRREFFGSSFTLDTAK
jgi:hypothetical protein